jgi:hypothetical protein
MLGTRESERLKVTALNLLKLPLKIAELPGEVIIFRIVSLRDTLPANPTAPPPFQEVGFFILRHSLWGEGRVGDSSFKQTILYFNSPNSFSFSGVGMPSSDQPRCS